jgi:hypothetical protein
MSQINMYELRPNRKALPKQVALLCFILLSIIILSSSLQASFTATNVEDRLTSLQIGEQIEVVKESIGGRNSYIIKRNDLTLNDLQNTILSYDAESNELYTYFMTNGFLERFIFRGDSLSLVRIDTLYNQGEEFSAQMMVLPEEQTIIMWEAAIGHVFEYSMVTGELVRIDRSRVRDFMFGAGTVYTDSLGIFAFGGYGLWEHKDFLLQYSFDLREWLKVESKGTNPPESGANYLWRYPDKPELLYSNNGGVNSRFRDKGLRQIDLYTFNLLSKTWMKRARHIFSDDINLYGISFRHHKGYSIDPELHLAHFQDRLFIDLETFEILELSKAHFPNINSVTAFYNEQLKQWLLVGRKSTMDARNLWIIPAQLTKDMLLPVTSMSMVEYVFRYELLFVLGSVIGVIVLVVGFKKVNAFKKKSSSSDQIYLELSEGQLVIQKNGDFVLMNDEYIEKIWSIIYRQKQKNEAELMMVDFDEELFTVSNSTSYRSKMKAKLFEEVNLGLQGFVIRAKRSSLDKRYKVIEINLSIIETA